MPDLRPAVSRERHATAWIDLATRAVDDVANHAPVADRANVVLVAHSGAGRLVMGAAGSSAVTAVVLVDAGLPGEATHAEGAPASFRDHLAALVATTDGVTLPPWPDWWPDDLLASVLPDPHDRAALAADAPRVVTAFFDEPIPDGARRAPAHVGVAYLCFTYEREAEEAERRGWPVERFDGGHLHQMVEPRAVASSIARLAAASA